MSGPADGATGGEQGTAKDPKAPGSADKESPTTPRSSAENLEKVSSSRLPKVTESLRKHVSWTMSTFFHFNPHYFLQFRGIMNIIHVIISLIIVGLLGNACQLRPQANSSSEGFFCKAPETFLFVSACGAFFTSLVYFFCCLLSKRTEALLFQTTFEVSYFILYAILNIVASVTMLITGFQTDMENVSKAYDPKVVYATAVLGFINGIMYGTSTVVFFISHKYDEAAQVTMKDLETVANLG